MSFLHIFGLARVAACLGLLLAHLAVGAGAGNAPSADEFAWRATLVLPAGASLARVSLPVQALLHMQSSSGQDVRIFNAAGAVVPFAPIDGAELTRAGPVAQTPSYKAYPLFAAGTGARPTGTAVEVHVDSAGQSSSAWVRWDTVGVQPGATQVGAQALQAALFDMRAEMQRLDAITLVLELPHNALVPIRVATSSDLKEWTELATKGPLFQFDGVDAPANTTLELRQPQQLQGRYLRLAWHGQAGVAVSSLTGRVAATRSAPEPVRAVLPPGTADGKTSLSWTLPFATPIAALHLQAQADNTLAPVRILGRSELAQPWRTLASTVVYRLDTVGQGSRNPPTALHGASVRALRVEAGKGMTLPEGGLQATVEFAPVQLAFLASGGGPFTLAVGRPQTAAAAVAHSLLGAVSATGLAELPVASVTNAQVNADTAMAGQASQWLPAGTSPRSALLWAVLGLGVLALAGVAWSLVRQLGAKR